MRQVQHGLVAGPVCVLSMLAALPPILSFGPAGMVAGAATVAGLGAVLAVGMRRYGVDTLGPADLITLLRAVLGCAVAAMVIGTLLHPGPRGMVVLLTAVCIALDGLDGHVARRTGTTSAFGARFDMETDAFLILVLSLAVAPASGWWVLIIGGARYLLLAARHRYHWLRGELPPRRWCKVVAVTQAVALTLVLSGTLGPVAATVVLISAIGLLAESFGREVWGLWRVAHPSSQTHRATGRVTGRPALEPVP